MLNNPSDPSLVRKIGELAPKVRLWTAPRDSGPKAAVVAGESADNGRATGVLRAARIAHADDLTVDRMIGELAPKVRLWTALRDSRPSSNAVVGESVDDRRVTAILRAAGIAHADALIARTDTLIAGLRADRKIAPEPTTHHVALWADEHQDGEHITFVVTLDEVDASGGHWDRITIVSYPSDLRSADRTHEQAVRAAIEVGRDLDLPVFETDISGELIAA